MSGFYLGTRQRPVSYYNKVSINSSPNQTSSFTLKDSAFSNNDTSVGNVITNGLGLSVVTKYTSQAAFTFNTVTSIKCSYVRDVSEQYGLSSYTMVPWYTKATVITITGLDYLGAFVAPNAISSILNNLTASNKNNMMTSICNEFISVDKIILNHNAFPGNALGVGDTILSGIQIGNSGENDCRKYFGFIKSLEVSESEESPFVQQYTLTYLGIDKDFLNAYLQMPYSAKPVKGVAPTLITGNN